MKRLLMNFGAIGLSGLLLAPVHTYAGAPPIAAAQPELMSIRSSDVGKGYRFALSDADSDNNVSLTVVGQTVLICRKTNIQHEKPDKISICRGDNTLDEEPVDMPVAATDGSYAYEYRKDMAGYPDGVYRIKVLGNLNGYRYEVSAVEVVKNGGECYLPESDSLSRRQNYALLQRLSAGGAPNDFEVLRSQFTGDSDSRLLAEIQVKTNELVEGCLSDREKVKAISAWISTNIAYDITISKMYEEWVRRHPEDSDRLDNPLRAFRLGYAQCYGYAKLTVLMMGYAGIPSVYIRGWMFSDIDSEATVQAIPENEIMNHAWNAVQIDGEWHFIDTCRDADNYYYEDGMEGFVAMVRPRSGLHKFLSLENLSSMQFAMRLGAEGYGEKIRDIPIPTGWQTRMDGQRFYYVNGEALRNIWTEIDDQVYYFTGDGVAVSTSDTETMEEI